jgi:hypothetical protein
MSQVGRTLRKAALVSAATASTASGLFLLFRLMPDHVRIAPTAALVGLMALLVLPGVTLAALELDRRAARRAEARRAAPSSEHSARRDLHDHGVRPESGERHRRRLRAGVWTD